MLSVDKELSNCDGIGIGRKGTIDKPQYLSAPFWTVDTLFFMTPFENYDIKFLFSMTQIVNWKKLDESTGVPSLSKSVIEKLEQNFPSIKEQEIIGLFFKQLDNTIALHQRKIELLQQLKKAYLQNLLPTKNKLTPKLRFANFKDDWKFSAVSDISKLTFGGGTPSTSVNEYWSGSIPWIQSSDLKLNELTNVTPTKYITNDAINKSAAKIIPKNSIAVVTRVGVGKLAIIPYSYSTSQDFLSLSELTLDTVFAAYTLYKLLEKESNIIQGTSIKGMTKSDLLGKKIPIPLENTEQVRIGKTLKKLDDIILVYQSKIERIEYLKQAYLQKMFI